MKKNAIEKPKIEAEDIKKRKEEEENMPNGEIILFIRILLPGIILGILGNIFFGASGALIGFFIGMILGFLLRMRGV